jgi:hypothetical protein
VRFVRQTLKAVDYVLVSSAETIGAFNTGFHIVILHHPTLRREPLVWLKKLVAPGRRVNENKHSTKIGAGLNSRLNGHTSADERTRFVDYKFNVGRVDVFNNPHARTSGTGTLLVVGGTKSLGRP